MTIEDDGTISETCTCTSEQLFTIWEQHIRNQPSRHPMSGWSTQGGKIIAILGSDGVWHDITETPPDPD